MTKSSKNGAAKSSAFIAVAHRPLPTGDGFRTVYARFLADGEVSYTPTRTLAHVFTTKRAADTALDQLCAARGLEAFGLQHIG